MGANSQGLLPISAVSEKWVLSLQIACLNLCLLNLGPENDATVKPLHTQIVISKKSSKVDGKDHAGGRSGKLDAALSPVLGGRLADLANLAHLSIAR